MVLSKQRVEIFACAYTLVLMKRTSNKNVCIYIVYVYLCACVMNPVQSLHTVCEVASPTVREILFAYVYLCERVRCYQVRPVVQYRGLSQRQDSLIFYY